MIWRPQNQPFSLTNMSLPLINVPFILGFFNAETFANRLANPISRRLGRAEGVTQRSTDRIGRAIVVCLNNLSHSNWIWTSNTAGNSEQPFFYSARINHAACQRHPQIPKNVGFRCTLNICQQPQHTNHLQMSASVYQSRSTQPTKSRTNLPLFLWTVKTVIF